VLRAVAADAYGAFEPRIRRVVSDTLGVDDHALVLASSLADDLAADSLDLVQLVVALEAEFDLAIADDTLGRVRTYGELVTTMCTLVGGSAAPASSAPSDARRATRQEELAWGNRGT